MKCIIISLCILISNIEIIFPQSQSLPTKQDNTSFVFKKNISSQCQNELTKYSIDKFDSITIILDKWEKYCGKIEPIIRVRILLDIYHKSFNDTTYAIYLNNSLIYKFHNRINDAKQYNYKDINEKYLDRIDYVPLNSVFDAWTKEIAIYLLDKQLPKSSEYLYCLLFSEDVDYFDYKVYSNEFKHNYINNNYVIQNKTSITFESGLWLPSGKLSNTFSIGPQYGLQLGYTINKRLRFDFILLVGPIKSKHSFSAKENDTIRSINGTMVGELGIRFTHSNEIKNRYFFDYFCGFEGNEIGTNYKIKENDYVVIQTYGISLGINLRKRIFRKSSIGISLGYHYVPYNWVNQLIKNIGSNVFTTSIFYRI